MAVCPSVCLCARPQVLSVPASAGRVLQGIPVFSHFTLVAEWRHFTLLGYYYPL